MGFWFFFWHIIPIFFPESEHPKCWWINEFCYVFVPCSRPVAARAAPYRARGPAPLRLASHGSSIHSSSVRQIWATSGEVRGWPSSRFTSRVVKRLIHECRDGRRWSLCQAADIIPSSRGLIRISKCLWRLLGSFEMERPEPNTATLFITLL